MAKFAFPRSYQKVVQQQIARVPSTPEQDVWIDMGSYWLNNSPQGSDCWYHLREYRLTASNFGTAIGKSTFTTPIKLAEEMAGLSQKVVSLYSQDIMRHGTETEEPARNWYSRARGAEVRELGLAIPKWDTRIGASLDGEVIGNPGMIEIKCPDKIYRGLIEHLRRMENGWNPPTGYHDHIYDTHYCQMQGGMVITNKEWCDYVVYATESKQVFTDRLSFNRSFWDYELYPGICSFLDEKLYPLLGDKRPVLPS